MKSSSFTWVTCQSSAMFHSICSNSYNFSGYEFPGILGTTTSWKKNIRLNFLPYILAMQFIFTFSDIWIYLGVFSPSPSTISTCFHASSPGSKPIALLPRIKPRLVPQQQRTKITKKSLEELLGSWFFRNNTYMGLLGTYWLIVIRFVFLSVFWCFLVGVTFLHALFNLLFSCIDYTQCYFQCFWTLRCTSCWSNNTLRRTTIWRHCRTNVMQIRPMQENYSSCHSSYSAPPLACILAEM